MTRPFILLPVLVFTVGAVQAQSAAYPPSQIVKDLTIEPGRQAIGDGDNWPVTWADDGNQYTVYCDGAGFGGGSGQGSMSLAKVSGTPPNITGQNIPSPTAHKLGGGHEGRKASGLLMVDGVLHMWVRNLNKDGTGSSMAWSKDHARTWSWADWNFPDIGYPVWMNAGQNYQAAQDNYAYMYSPDTSSAYKTSDHILLARVPKSRITEKESYEFFAGLDEQGKARLARLNANGTVDQTFNPGASGDVSPVQRSRVEQARAAVLPRASLAVSQRPPQAIVRVVADRCRRTRRRGSARSA